MIEDLVKMLSSLATNTPGIDFIELTSYSNGESEFKVGKLTRSGGYTDTQTFTDPIEMLEYLEN